MKNHSFDLESRKDVTGFYNLFSKVPYVAYSAVPHLAGLAGGNSPLDPIVGKFFFALSCKRLSSAITSFGKPIYVEMAGLGLGMTFILHFERSKLAVRVKNELRERQVHCFWDEQQAFLIENSETRFKREAETLSVLYQEGLSPKHIGWDNDHICIEFIEGESLFSLAKSAKLSKKHIDAAFSAMKDMHDLGISHADSNLANFLFSKSGSVKLIDFELAYNSRYVEKQDMSKIDFAMFFERFNQYLPSIFPEYTKILLSSLEATTDYSAKDLLVVMKKYPIIFKRGTEKFFEGKK